MTVKAELDEMNSSASSAGGTKRKADETASDQDVKRIKQEVEGESVQPDSDVPEPEPAQNRSPEFWYEDGNVVIVVGNTAFKLYKARLSRFSAALAARFAQDDGSSRPLIQACPVYELADVSVEDLTELLTILENPALSPSPPPSQDTLISILRASQALDCSTTRAFAVDNLRALWPDTDPKLPGPRRSAVDAIKIIRLSRECAVPELRKRAFYELLRNPPFFNTVAKDRTRIPLPDADIIALLMAKSDLQHRWCLLVMKPPYPSADACPNVEASPSSPGRQKDAHCQRRFVKGWSRKVSWRSDLVDTGDFDAGRADPIGYLQTLMTEKSSALAAAGWCRSCLGERAKAWGTAQAQWWASLDNWFKS